MKETLIAFFTVIIFLLSLTLLLGTAKTRGDPGKRQIALTFDDGPSSYTREILDLLEREHVNATFFFIGIQVQGMEELVARAAVYEIGVHGQTHKALLFASETIEEEIEESKNRIEEATGKQVRYFRPPYGLIDNRGIRIARQQGLELIGATYYCPDYQMRSAEQIADNVIRRFKNGAIIALHDGGGDRTKTVEALSRIIQAAREQGYSIVSLEEV